MTRKTTRSTGSKSTPRRAGSQKQAQINLIMIIAVIAVVAIAGGCYLLTGTDILGLFGSAEETPTAVTSKPSATPKTSQPLPTATTGGASAKTWWHVYFTDPVNMKDPDKLAGSTEEKLIDYINGAQKTIHVAAFEFNLTPVAEALIAAHKRGVEVQWVTDDENGLDADEEEGHGQFAMLKKAGIKVKDDKRSALMHNKFWIFDNKIVWTGSTNVTVNCNFRNNNNVIVFESPELAQIYEQQFAEMWGGEFSPSAPSAVDQQQVTIDGTAVQVLFSPEDNAISHLIPVIKAAKKSIRFMAFSFTHTELGAAVLERAKAGVDVKGIFETRGSETEYSELTLLYCAKLAVRQDGNPQTFHHKVFIIDDKIVITGSLNFTSNADESNNENTNMITNRDIAALYLQEFERRWAEAKEPDIKCK